MGLHLEYTQKHDYEKYAELASKSNKTITGLVKDLYVYDEGGREQDVYDTGEVRYVKDNAIGFGYFPTNAFELIDYTVHLPLKKFFAPTLVPIKTGGGAVELVSAFRTNRAPAEMQLATGQGNSVPLVNADRQKYRVPVSAWEAGIFLGKVDLMFANQGNYSVLEQHVEALRDSYWYRIERNALQGNIGIKGITSPSSDGFVGGLLNSVPASQQITSQDFTKAVPTDLNFLEMTLPQLVALFTKVIQAQKSAVRYNPDFYINRGILPPELYANLAQPAVLNTGATGAVYESKMDYLVKELKKLNNNIEIKFEEVPYVGDPTLEHNKGYAVSAPGANSLGQIILYNQNERALHFAIPMPLTLSPILPSVTENGYRQNGLTFLADGILLHYPETLWSIVNVETDTGE